MLRALVVRNLAIVESVEVPFEAGLNVITGETGAGKSLLIDALNLVLGGRAEKSMIRTGEAEGSVEALFQLADAERVDAVLRELGLEPCEQGQLVIRRAIAVAGSGRTFINDRPCTAQALRRVGEHLIDLHGPHDHQSLLDQGFQIDLLDAFGRHAAQRNAYATIYAELLDLERRRVELEGDDRQLDRELDLLKYQIGEIEAARLSAPEAATLEDDHRVAAHAQEIVRRAGEACAALTDAEPSAFDRLVEAQRALDALTRLVPDAEAWRREAAAANAQIQALSRALQDYAERLDSDPGRLAALEERKALYEKLRRKYGASVEAILEFLQQAVRRRAELESRGVRLEEIRRAHADATQRLAAAGEQLGGARRKASRRLAAAITSALRDLGFADGVFEIGLAAAPPGPAGCDEVDFRFAPNVGEAMRPLRSIASSGEISRVMLAAKAVLAAHDRIPILVFDEIDANVGGEMGQAIGQKLAGVAGAHQVICITHLPQVAVHGSAHLAVRKTVERGRTYTRIQPLDREARVGEIARMLGGETFTSVTMKHAREMLANA